MSQDIRFIDLEGRSIAYSVYGEGPPLVFGPRWVSHLEEEWDDRDQRAFYAELASTHQVVRFDRIGCGLSSRELEPRPTVELESRQLEAVIDAVGGEAVVSSPPPAAASPRHSFACAVPARSRSSCSSAATRRATTSEITKQSLIMFTRVN
jgi:hypothetical protein